MSSLNRLGLDRGLELTKDWLNEWYGDIDELEITKLTIPYANNSEYDPACDPIYQAAQIGKQTPLHAFLKFLAYKWLKIEYPAYEPRFEAQMYFSDEELIDKCKIRMSGTSFDIRKSQVIERGRTDVIASYGEIMIADVYIPGVSLEVGYTRPYNLLMPLLEGLVSKAIWLPFPESSQPKLFVPQECAFAEFNAYEITFI